MARTAAWRLARLLWPCLLAASCTAPAGPPPQASPTPAGASLATSPAGVVSAATAAPTAAPEAATIRVAAQVSTLTDAGLYLGDALGYFREQGITVDRQALQTGPQAVAPLAAGQLEIVAAAPSAGLLNALGRGIAVKIVADKGRDAPGFAFQSLLVRQELVDSGAFRDGRDLRGRRLALPGLGIPLEASVATGLAQYGLSMADVQVEQMGFPDMVAAFANGAIDAGVELEPIATETLQRGLAVLWKPISDFYPEGQAAVIMYGPSLTESNPALARRWMVAYVRGLRTYNDALRSPDAPRRREVLDVLASATRVAPALVTEIADAHRLPKLDPDGRVNAEALRVASAYWRQSGTQTVDLSIDQIMDDQYVDAAVQVLGPYRP